MDWILLDSIGLDWIGFYWILLDSIGLDWILLDSIGFYWILLDFIGFYWILLDWIGLECRVQNENSDWSETDVELHLTSNLGTFLTRHRYMNWPNQKEDFQGRADRN